VSRSADERIARSLDIAVEHTNKVFEEIELLFSDVDGITRRRIGGIAQDFNKLLSIVMGNLEAIVRRTPDEDKTHRQARTALTGAERASQLVRLLAFSRRQPFSQGPSTSTRSSRKTRIRPQTGKSMYPLLPVQSGKQPHLGFPQIHGALGLVRLGPSYAPQCSPAGSPFAQPGLKPSNSVA
jgi:hypothetical protein